MTWRDTCAQLAVARDAFMEGRWVEAKRLADEVAPDHEWQRKTRGRAHPRPMVDDYYWEDYDDGDDDYTPATTPMVERRRQRVQEWRRIDWLAWLNPLTTVGSFDAMLRAHYSPDAVAQLAYRPNPFIAAPPRHSGDAIEARIRSYVNIQKPGWNGVFTIPDDD